MRKTIFFRWMYLRSSTDRSKSRTHQDLNLRHTRNSNQEWLNSQKSWEQLKWIFFFCVLLLNMKVSALVFVLITCSPIWTDIGTIQKKKVFFVEKKFMLKTPWFDLHTWGYHNSNRKWHWGRCCWDNYKANLRVEELPAPQLIKLQVACNTRQFFVVRECIEFGTNKKKVCEYTSVNIGCKRKYNLKRIKTWQFSLWTCHKF